MLFRSNSKFGKGDAVAISGYVESYVEKLQLIVRKINKATVQYYGRYGFNPVKIVPSSKKDPYKMWKTLISIVKEIKRKELQRLIFFIYKSNKKKILIHPGSIKSSFNFRSGFLEQALSMAQLAKKISPFYNLDKEIVIGGVLLIKIGVLKQIKSGYIIDYSKEGNLLGQAVISRDILNNGIKKIKNFPEDLKIKLEHILLSYENNFQRKTSYRPSFPEAFLVHSIYKMNSNMNLMEKMLTKMGQGKSEIQQMDAGFLPIGWSFKRSACDSDFEEVVADVLEKQIADEFPERLVLYNQVKTCGYRLDFVIYDKLSKKAVGIEVDGKHHYLADDSSYTDEHLERANSLKRAGWIIKYLPYWNWFEDGWIEDDAAAANDLREFIRRFFVIENEEEFISGNEKDKQLADQDKKDLSSEETNFLSIPLYSSERTGRERKKPLPKEFLKEWNKEIQDSGALNPKKELD